MLLFQSQACASQFVENEGLGGVQAPHFSRMRTGFRDGESLELAQGVQVHQEELDLRQHLAGRPEDA
jgi:hypothetical protein